MARTGYCEAAVGSTTAGMSGLLTATGTSLPTATTTPAFALPELKNKAGRHFFDPTFIRSAYDIDIVYNMQQKESGPRYVSRIEQMPNERLPGDLFFPPAARRKKKKQIIMEYDFEKFNKKY
jgi:hypothetical protein